MTPRYACNLAPGCISSEPTFAGLRKNPKKKRKQGVPKKGSPKKKGKRGFLWQSLTSLEMQPGAKLRRIRVLGASQVEYKPFGEPPLKRELGLSAVGDSTFQCGGTAPRVRQAAEPPQSPGSLLYVLYVLYGSTPSRGTSTLPQLLAICTICAILFRTRENL